MSAASGASTEGEEGFFGRLREADSSLRDPAPRKTGGRRGRVAPFGVTVCGGAYVGAKGSDPQVMAQTFAGWAGVGACFCASLD